MNNAKRLSRTSGNPFPQSRVAHTRIPQFMLCGYVPKVIHSLRQLYFREHTHGNAKQVRELKAVLPWKTLDCRPLVHEVRQNDAVFSSFLMRLADILMLTEYDVRLINSRFVTREEAAEKGPDGIRPYCSNADVDRYNARCLDAVYNVLCHPACDNITGYKNEQVHMDALTILSKINASDMGGLPASICLSIGKPYMITANIDISDGLVNGNIGTLWYIESNEHGNLVRLYLEFPTSTVGIVVPDRT